MRQTELPRPWLSFAVLAVLAGNSAAQTLQFVDQTAAAGITFTQTSGPGAEVTMMNGGGAVGDFNRDGYQDLFVLGGPGAADRLFINNGDGTFTDRAASWGVAATHWGFGIAVGDYNRDGWLDIYITSGGTNGFTCFHRLYRNNGNNTFTDVAGTARVRDTTDGGAWDGFGAAWGDYDLDGYLDLAVAGWVGGSGSNRLFHNQGTGVFLNYTSVLNHDMTLVRGYSPRFIDMNGDRYPELIWVADFSTSRYFVNNTNGMFTESHLSAGVGLEGNGMGMTIGDFNADGRPDLYVTSIYTHQLGHPGVPGTGNMLYLNNGANHFTEVSDPSFVKNTGWGWGTVAVDFRNIGRQDIVATNGWQGGNYDGEFLADPTCVFAANANGTFTNTAPACGVIQSAQGRGLLSFDADNDGRQDLVIFENSGPITYYRNTTPDAGHYLRIFLDSHTTPGLAPDGYGAHVVLTTGGVAQHRWICGGSNYLSQSELSAHFGLGAATLADQLRVDWPNGDTTIWNNVAADRTIVLTPCPADFNRDGMSSVQDLFDFLASYFQGNADFNLSGVTSLQDIFDFLAAWFGGCQ